MLIKAFRLFVSSTFADFADERKLLQSQVFPALDAYCTAKGYQFYPVDLRWGVNEEAQLDQRTAEICLGEVRAATSYPPPNFLIMIGNRYGWVPLPYAIAQDEFETIVEWLLSHGRRNEARALEYAYQRDDNHLVLRSKTPKPRRVLPRLFKRSNRPDWKDRGGEEDLTSGYVLRSRRRGVLRPTGSAGLRCTLCCSPRAGHSAPLRRLRRRFLARHAQQRRRRRGGRRIDRPHRPGFGLREPAGADPLRALRGAGGRPRLRHAGDGAGDRPANSTRRARQQHRRRPACAPRHLQRALALGQPVRDRAGLHHPLPRRVAGRAGGGLRAPLAQPRCGGPHARRDGALRAPARAHAAAGAGAGRCRAAGVRRRHEGAAGHAPLAPLQLRDARHPRLQLRRTRAVRAGRAGRADHCGDRAGARAAAAPGGGRGRAGTQDRRAQ